MNEEMEDNGSFITLTDDNGEDVSFEVLDLIEYKEREFVVLLPFEDTEDEVVILEVIAGEDEETDEFISVDDEDLLEEVFAEFLKRAEDEQ
ncbi:MAG: DUF1292 domain-containing protein [Ruminococcus sp.]|nr:DUF1292 domain-containing protein [Ruminococcus sp.]